jgi:hypothetical protein
MFIVCGLLLKPPSPTLPPKVEGSLGIHFDEEKTPTSADENPQHIEPIEHIEPFEHQNHPKPLKPLKPQKPPKPQKPQNLP